MFAVWGLADAGLISVWNSVTPSGMVGHFSAVRVVYLGSLDTFPSVGSMIR